MSLLFRPLRTLMMLAFAFAAGIGFDRIKHSERCQIAGGSVLAGLCTGEDND
ncbi:MULTISPECIES: hypothetical protein [Parasedimentitalea]|uniref:Uncharacterized protein n=1 Tax=Parasedimentitalea maritima TaxID=2578117 RepID=A0A6A4REW5_9RHOB|nr:MULTISPECIES: hypothetical protein [Zongyanglinia]KAE9628992.1 hypothetical protein GP644_14605 [Zongyanglinia marina]